MKIQPISQYNPYYKGLGLGRRITSNPISKEQELSCTKIPFDIEILTKKEDAFFEKFINKSGKVTLEEYEDIARNHPRTLSKCYDICEKIDSYSTPKEIAKAALSLKDKYDNEFNDYVIVSIGNSPAPITELMSTLGCNTIFLPLSNLRWFKPEILDSTFLKPRNISLLMKYCNKKGLTKNRNVILLDYCASGRTLSNTSLIFEKYMQTDKQNYHTRSIIEELREISSGNNKCNITYFDIESIKEDMRGCRLEKVGNVPHFSFDNNKRHHDDEINSNFKTASEVFKEFENYSTPEGRAWALCVIHEAINICKSECKY